MEKILYIDSNLVSKTYRKHNPCYMIVDIVEELNYGKAKVECYWFDIPCAYAPANSLGFDVVDKKDIKELNWYNLLNDIKKGHYDRKYWYWEFLRTQYPYSFYYGNHNSRELTIAYKNEIIAQIDTNVLPDWCKGQYVLYKMDIVLDDMIQRRIEYENCVKLKEIIRTDEVTMTTEDYLRMKGYIN
jgi:hypothetical protein